MTGFVTGKSLRTSPGLDAAVKAFIDVAKETHCRLRPTPFPVSTHFLCNNNAQLEHLLTGKDIKEPLISSSPHCDGLNRRVELIKDY